MNRLDEIVLHGRDPHEPVTLLAYERLRYAAICAVIILGIGIAAMFFVVQHAVDHGQDAHDQLRVEISHDRQRIRHLETDVSLLRE